MEYKQIREVHYKDVNGLLEQGWQYIGHEWNGKSIIYIVGLPKYTCEHSHYSLQTREENPPTQKQYDPRLMEWFCIECAEAEAYNYDTFFEQYGRIPGGRPHNDPF